MNRYVRISAAFLSVLVFACGAKDVNLYAPPELAGAIIKVDGKHTATLSTTTRNYRWVGWRGLRKELNAPPRSETFAHFSISAGEHILVIEKRGFHPIVRRFTSGRESLTIDISSATPRPVSRAPDAALEEPASQVPPRNDSREGQSP